MRRVRAGLSLDTRTSYSAIRSGEVHGEYVILRIITINTSDIGHAAMKT